MSDQPPKPTSPWFTPKGKAPAAPEVPQQPPSQSSPPFPFLTQPSNKVSPAKPSAYDRFLASMNMTYDKWHDGEPYDLAALADLTPEEKTRLTQLLLNRSPRDWRDIDALGTLNTPAAKAAITAALNDANPSIRQHAQRFAPEQVSDKKREKLLIKALLTTQIYGGLTQALDEAAEFHPPAVVDALLKGCMSPTSEGPVHFAALLFYIHGIAKSPFDWDHRPFFLKFAEPNLAKRKLAFLELCQEINIDPAQYL